MMPLPTIEDVSPRSYADPNGNVDDVAFAKHGCCFRFPFGGNAAGGSVFWQRIDPQYDGSNPETPTVAPNEDSWWIRGWMKLREWSEIIAGPKWKTLIRRLNNGNGVNRRRVAAATGGLQAGKFQYDPLSYSLNFDDCNGRHGSQLDDDLYYSRGFSSRFSLPPSSAKSSIDFDKEGLSFA